MTLTATNLFSVRKTIVECWRKRQQRLEEKDNRLHANMCLALNSCPHYHTILGKQLPFERDTENDNRNTSQTRTSLPNRKIKERKKKKQKSKQQASPKTRRKIVHYHFWIYLQDTNFQTAFAIVPRSKKAKVISPQNKQLIVRVKKLNVVRLLQSVPLDHHCCGICRS